MKHGTTGSRAAHGRWGPLATLVAIAILTVAGTCPRLLAGTGSVHTLPIAGRKAANGRALRNSGLKLTIDTTWVDGSGYRPVRLEVTTRPLVPAVADRTLEIELRPKTWIGAEGRLVVSRTIEIPQGSTGVVATLSVPQSQPWYELNIDVWEDGRHLDDISIDHLTVAGGAQPFRVVNYDTESVPTVLVIDSAVPANAVPRRRPGGGQGQQPGALRLPDIRVLANLLPTAPQQYQLNQAGQPDLFDLSQVISDANLMQKLGDVPALKLLSPAELPAGWIDYSCFDMIFISLGDLKRLAAGNTAQWQALHGWLAAGGNLCVYGAGEDYERLAELEKLLGMQPASRISKTKAALRGWSAPDPNRFGHEVVSLQAMRNSMGYRDWPRRVAGNAGGPGIPARKKPPQPDPFVWRELLMGHVVAIGSASPFPGTRDQWNWLLNSIEEKNWMWHQRHGLSLTQENVDFWRFLIPGVGMAPVNGFRVLITLFVVLIGPVNYVLLRRKRRMHLLLVTIPAGAALVTGSLFAYAMVSDGLGVRARMRSYTQIDQRQGWVVSWSRHAYYAGLAPSSGLSFPSDAAVYPLEEIPAAAGEAAPRRRLEWDDQQSLAAGYLTSRVTSQFLVVRSRRTSAGLKIVEDPDGQSPPRIENHLGAKIEQLLLQDSRGRTYWAEQVEPGAVTTVQPTDQSAARSRLKAILRENYNTEPEGFSFASRRVVGRRRRRPWGPTFSSSIPPSFSTSLMERNLQKALTGRGGAPAPRRYVAVIESCPEVAVGVPSARQEVNFHVLEGRW